MISVAEVVLRQTTFYNGHGQMEISEMTLSDLRETVRGLQSKGGGELWYIRLYEEGEGKMSASVYEENGITMMDTGYAVKKDKLWLGVENVTLGEY